MLGLLLVVLSLPALSADDPLQEAADRCNVEELKRMFDSGEARGNPPGWSDPLIIRIVGGYFFTDAARHEAAMALAVERGLSLKTRDGYAKTILTNVVMWPGKTNAVNKWKETPPDWAKKNLDEVAILAKA